MDLFAKIFRTGIVTRPLGPVHGDAIEVARAIDARSRRLFGFAAPSLARMAFNADKGETAAPGSPSACRRA